jgi:N-acetylmuramoyl-L-alanine amidase
VEEQQNKSTMMRNGKLALKGLTKEEKDKIKKTRKKNKRKRRNKTNGNKDKPKQSKRQKKANPEFKYIDEVPRENLQGNRIFVDPGKDH